MCPGTDRVSLWNESCCGEERSFSCLGQLIPAPLAAGSSLCACGPNGKVIGSLRVRNFFFHVCVQSAAASELAFSAGASLVAAVQKMPLGDPERKLVC